MKKIGILFKKEMTEILRDKKTLIIMLIMPLIVYPAMLIGLSLGISMIMQSQAEDSQIVGYSIEDEEYIQALKAIYERQKDDFDYNIVFQSADEENMESVREEADIWVSFEAAKDEVKIKVNYTSTDADSNYAEDTLKDLSELYRDEVIFENLQAAGLTEDFLHPVTYEAIDSVSTTESIGMYYGGLIGMLLITMIMLGAFYPAVDITTGEKERGTLETLLTLPVTNFQMIMSKFIAVSVVACVTALISLIALGGSVLFLMLAVPENMTNDMIQLPLETILGNIPLLFIALMATALLITAICMCFCVFAKSSKEANNYMTPVMLVIMMTSMVGLIPTIELNATFAIIPIVNVSLLFKQVMSQHLDIVLALTTIGVNLLYSVLIIWILAKMYDSEDIMFSDGFRSFRLFQKHSDIEKGTVPATGDIIVALVVTFLLMVYVGGIFSAKNVFVGTVVTQLTILAVPLVMTWYMKSDKKQLFSLNKPISSKIPGSILLYIGTYLLMIAISSILSKCFPESLQNLNGSFDEIMNHSFIAVTIVIALMPAIGEELLFRGLTFGGLRVKYKLGWAIVISAIIFGLFHTSIVKLLPTAMLGACFAFIVYKTGSIYISMFLHFLNNFISIIAMKAPETFENLLSVFVKDELSAIEFICIMLIGIVSSILGVFMLGGMKKNKKPM